MTHTTKLFHYLAEVEQKIADIGHRRTAEMAELVTRYNSSSEMTSVEFERQVNDLVARYRQEADAVFNSMSSGECVEVSA